MIDFSLEGEEKRAYAWVTDLHLDGVDAQGVSRFFQELTSHPFEGVLITGDISDTGDFSPWLEKFVRELPFPIYFVLGNHDHWNSGIAASRERAARLSREEEKLRYLTDEEFVELKGGVCPVRA